MKSQFLGIHRMSLRLVDWKNRNLFYNTKTTDNGLQPSYTHKNGYPILLLLHTTWTVRFMPNYFSYSFNTET